MSAVVLSQSVRATLVSLQSTANLLATTQNDLATGKTVNSALDNPTNFFTAQGLDNRAGDINNLLDGISNGVQVLQAANTGITSIQKLVDTAKSIANQALQTTAGYTTKSSIDFAGAGAGTGSATAADLTGGGGATGSKLIGAKFELKDASGKDVTITVGSTYSALSGGAATVKSLDDLNNVLSAAGLSVSASLTAANTVSFTSTNDASGQAITTSGTAPTTSDAIDIKDIAATPSTGVAHAAVADVSSQATRSSLINQYNQILDQIKTTAQDSSFNGVNLLNGDQLKLVFNETGKSTLNIQGVTFDPAGLGLTKLDNTTGNNFNDNASTNAVLSSLTSASSSLRSQASALGSNLSIVQIRQDFSKNLINVLQTGSNNLTLADPNEEAANSQALSTRQSIAVSALALANQSQQGVLQLLR